MGRVAARRDAEALCDRGYLGGELLHDRARGPREDWGLPLLWDDVRHGRATEFECKFGD
jgi:hypothetical protein